MLVCGLQKASPCCLQVLAHREHQQLGLFDLDNGSFQLDTSRLKEVKGGAKRRKTANQAASAALLSPAAGAHGPAAGGNIGTPADYEFDDLGDLEEFEQQQLAVAPAWALQKPGGQGLPISSPDADSLQAGHSRSSMQDCSQDPLPVRQQQQTTRPGPWNKVKR